jgi:predicted DNA-binding transcriptional regulator AlpA
MIDGPSIAAAAALSLSSWHELVRTGAAPQPAIRRQRCTRWRMADVRAWLIERAAEQTGDTADEVTARAKRASAEARKPEAVAKAQATRRARIAARATQAGA